MSHGRWQGGRWSGGKRPTFKSRVSASREVGLGRRGGRDGVLDPGSGRISPDARPGAPPNWRLLLSRFELVGKGCPPCSEHPKCDQYCRAAEPLAVRLQRAAGLVFKIREISDRIFSRLALG